MFISFVKIKKRPATFVLLKKINYIMGFTNFMKYSTKFHRSIVIKMNCIIKFPFFTGA